MPQPDMQDAATGAGNPGGNRQSETIRRGIAIDAYDIVQTIARQAAPRQRRIERRIAQPHGLAPPVAGPFQPRQVPAQEGEIEGSARHIPTRQLFIICSTCGAGSQAPVADGLVHRRPSGTTDRSGAPCAARAGGCGRKARRAADDPSAAYDFTWMWAELSISDLRK